MFDVIERDRKHLEPWLPWLANVTTLHDEELAMQNDALQNARLDTVFTAIVLDNSIVGAAKWAEIGYWIDAKHEGRGIVTRCVKKLEQLCFQELDCQRVQITNDVTNIHSRAIPEHLGYTLEGILKQHHVKDAYGTIGDQCIYVLLREEWHERMNELDS